MRLRATTWLAPMLAVGLAAAAAAQSARPNAAPAAAGPPPTAARPPSAPSPAAPAAAQTSPTSDGKIYDIEIVIFRARHALGSPEDWPVETGMAPTVAGGEAVSATAGKGRLLGLVPPSQYRLTPLANSLRASGWYTPVAHAAWRQTASDWGTHAGFTLDQLGIQVPGLTGKVFFERGQYLHLGMTLEYTMAHPPQGLDAAPGTTFVLNESRRVRFYQRDYYDHPAFGVIALVLPVRGPQPPGR